MDDKSFGILSFGVHIPYNRLRREEIVEIMGTGGAGGKGMRSVASYDEDTTTMGFEAARIALRDARTRDAGTPDAGTPDGRISPDALWFSTSSPAYLEKTNANAIHSALMLPTSAGAADFGGAARSGIAALGAACSAARAGERTMVIASDIRVGLPTGRDEAEGGDAAVALLVGPASPDNHVLAERLTAVSATREFTDRWRSPGDAGTKQWEERFGESVYVPLALDAFDRALTQAQKTPAPVDEPVPADAQVDVLQVDVIIVAGTHARSVKRVASKLEGSQSASSAKIATDLSATVGNTGTAHALLLLAQELESAEPDQVIAVVSMIDGADVLLFRTTDAIAQHQCSRPLARQVESHATLPYGKYLNWRKLLEVQPPNRLPPERPSASAAARNQDWKYGFVGSQGSKSNLVHLPPARVSIRPEDETSSASQARAEDQAADTASNMTPIAMADTPAVVVTHTVDRLVYSVSPPVVFAIVDFEGGGRLPVELTDVDVSEVEVGMPVEMVFRKLYTADGIHNYFWKARPQR